MQNYTIRRGKPASAFQAKIDGVIEKIEKVVIPEFEKQELLLSDEKRAIQQTQKYCLASIPNFQSLVAKMQESDTTSTPVFAIDSKQLGTGTVLENYLEKRELFKGIFSEMADLVLSLT